MPELEITFTEQEPKYSSAYGSSKASRRFSKRRNGS
ncbi:hypothetical protein DM80_2272 [Burkholderia multivorans]|nr:hypothetical protein DM80_2272 [Burkholderia multivorans]